jgi:hypothetical protein
MREKRVPAGERSIEYFDIEPLISEVRTQIQNTQRRVGLHDLKLFGIFVEKVTVR